MTGKIAGRIAAAGVVLAFTTVGTRAETLTLPTFDVFRRQRSGPRFGSALL
jgi:hypothetical protein